jgi:catechol 2,3-dioxygenase-like lactoylglutathione lyase family enzyme
MTPTLVVRDLDASVRWYRDALGFAVVYELPGLSGRPLLAHLRRGPHQELVLAAAATASGELGPWPGQGITLTLTVEERLDTLAARAASQSGSAASEAANGPRGAQELSLVDPDGYHLVLRSAPGGQQPSG